MPGYMQIEGIEGSSTDADHDAWINIESMSGAINRSIPSGAKDQQRKYGETTLGDVVVVRQLDKSSTKIQEACADGKFFDQVQIDFCSDIGSKRELNLSYVLKKVIITSYSFHGNASWSPTPSEQITMGYTEAEWKYTDRDPETGDSKGNIDGSYKPGKGGG